MTKKLVKLPTVQCYEEDVHHMPDIVVCGKLGQAKKKCLNKKTSIYKQEVAQGWQKLLFFFALGLRKKSKEDKAIGSLF